MKKNSQTPLRLSPQARIELEQVRTDLIRGRELVKKAQYKKAFLLAKKTLKKHPKNRFAIYRYAVTLGDSSSYVSAAQHRKNQAMAAKIFRSLLQKMNGIDVRWVCGFRNEYYWFSKQPYKQYRLGITRLSALGKNSLYSAGVGAATLSQNFYDKNKPRIAKQWALKSIKAWESFFTEFDDYYNAYAWYAKALGLTGDLTGMERALRKAAKLARQPLSYKEFQDTRKDVKKALRSQIK